MQLRSIRLAMDLKFSKSSIQIRSAKNERTYDLVAADSVAFDDATLSQIVSVCNEPEIHDNVFSAFLHDKVYTKENAQTFANLVLDGWKTRTRFNWLIVHEGSVVGTIGIKSLEGEIGYWQSAGHPGVMTKAVRSICSLAKDAGFSTLWAYVKKTNVGSVKVLERAGFKPDSNLTDNRVDAYGYRLNL